MDHHVVRDLLERYVDGELEEATRLEVDGHLAGCDECRSLLSEASHSEPVDLGPPPAAGEWDEQKMRRTVRRTLLRTVFDVLSLWVAGFIVLWLLSALAFQPLVIARGDRVRDARVASIDLPMLFVPGARVSSITDNARLFSRRIDVGVEMPVGGRSEELGVYSARLGILHFEQVGGRGTQDFRLSDPRPFEPDRLPAGTVVTVQFLWDEPIPLATAETLAGSDEYLVTWAGFAVSDGQPESDYPNAPAPGWRPGQYLGYSTCVTPDLEGLGTSQSGSIGGGWVAPRLDGPSVSGALQQVRRAMELLAEHPDWMEGFGEFGPGPQQNPEEAAEWLGSADPEVMSLVVTGPTEALARLVRSAEAIHVTQLGVELWNWEGPRC